MYSLGSDYLVLIEIIESSRSVQRRRKRQVQSAVITVLDLSTIDVIAMFYSKRNAAVQTTASIRQKDLEAVACK